MLKHKIYYKFSTSIGFILVLYFICLNTDSSSIPINRSINIMTHVNAILAPIQIINKFIIKSHQLSLAL